MFILSKDKNSGWYVRLYTKYLHNKFHKSCVKGGKKNEYVETVDTNWLGSSVIDSDNSNNFQQSEH